MTRPECAHPRTREAVEALGPMLERPDGRIVAHVTQWATVCTSCGATLAVHARAKRKEEA